MLHKNIILSDRHAPHNYEYVDSTARLAATGFVSGDVGKLAFQASDATYWVLASTTPTWSALKGEPGEPGAPGAGTGDVVGPASSVSGRVATFSGTSGKIIGDSGYSVSDLALASQRDSTGGYAGLTLFKINFKNALDTFTSFFTNANTAARTYTFKDADGTIAFTSDITGTNSGTNTGDNAVNTLYSGLVTNATHTGDATGSGALTVVALNGTSLAGLASGILKNTTATGVPSIAAAGTDYVTPTGTETLTNKTLTGYTETVYALSGTTPAFTEANGSIQTWTLSGASTPTDSLTTGQSLILQITPGAYSITWPSVTWTKQGGSGAAPTLYSAGKTNVILWKVGSTLYGSHLGDS